MVKALIDGDIIVNEVGFGSQQSVGGEVVPRDWEFAKDLCIDRIDRICREVEATSPPILFLSNKPFISYQLNKRRTWNDEEPVSYQENFRIAIAKERAYKGRRVSPRPFHFNNLLLFLLDHYDTYVEEKAREADDAMATYQSYSPPLTTIICSRDKDLRQIPGLHYTWELGWQRSWGPVEITPLGWLEKNTLQTINKKGETVLKDYYRGCGDLFLYYQMITGDSSDDVAGVIGKGKSFAYNLLKEAKTSFEAKQLTQEVYVKEWKDSWKEMWDEMYNLLYIQRTI